MAIGGKVQVVKSTPDDWGGSASPSDGHFIPAHDMQGQNPLPHGEIWLDPVHAELIGADLSEDEVWASMNIGDQPNIDPTVWMSPPRHQVWTQLVGDTPDVENEGNPEGTSQDADEDIPSTQDEGDPEATQMGPDSDAPGNSPQPGYTVPRGPTGAIGPMPGPIPGRAAHRLVARFQANVRAKNPQAIRALLAMQQKAKNDARAAAVFKRVSRPWTSKGRMVVRGEPALVSTVSNLLKTVLSPVAWGVHGVGTVSHEVGTTLTKLARKL